MECRVSKQGKKDRVIDDVYVEKSFDTNFNIGCESWVGKIAHAHEWVKISKTKSCEII